MTLKRFCTDKSVCFIHCKNALQDVFFYVNFNSVLYIEKFGLKWCILAESDNESVPTCSPIKAKRMVKVKTLEEIKLERIQAQAAAYYSYNGKFSNVNFQKNVFI